MKITKFGHSCLLIEENSSRILIDPGSWATVPDKLENIDAILVTHEHQDHYFPKHLKKIAEANPKAVIYANESVVELGKKEGLPMQALGHNRETNIKGVNIRGWGEWHAKIYDPLPVVRNTGYFVADRLFYPGDALTIPDRTVEILAYPAIAPWMKMSEALDYGKQVKPKAAFPVHDGFLKFGGPYYASAEKNFKELGTQWLVLEPDKSVEL